MSEYTIDPARYAAIDLKRGAHFTPDEGLCLMEAVAYLVGEKHSDRPLCVSPVLAAFGRGLNDCLGDRRQELKSLIPSLPGTADDGADKRRAFMALDWMVRTWLPSWLDLIPSEDAAPRLRALDRIVDDATANCARLLVRSLPHEPPRTTYDEDTAIHDVIGKTNAGALLDAAKRGIRQATYSVAVTAWGVAWLAIHTARKHDASVLEPVAQELQLSVIDLYRDMIKDPG